MKGIYKRYRVEKRKKLDLGQTGSQDSGASLVEVTGPMGDIMPPSPEDMEDVQEEEQEQEEAPATGTSQRDR